MARQVLESLYSSESLSVRRLDRLIKTPVLKSNIGGLDQPDER